MNSKLFLISLFICAAIISFIDSKNFVGSYVSHKPSGFEKLYFQVKYGTRTPIIRSGLRLEADSSFVLETCGFKAIGKWRDLNDELELIPKDGYFKNDSINTVRGGIDISKLRSKGLLNYEVTDNYLIAKVSKSTGGNVLLIFKSKLD
ncbi:MAG: hypothetical protein WBG46_02040 [Nonlabens sp.]